MGGKIFLKEINAALPGHLHVHGHDVRVQLGYLLPRVHGVDGVADHLDAGMGGEAFDDHAAGHDGIIHHHDADLFWCYHNRGKVNSLCCGNTA